MKIGNAVIIRHRPIPVFVRTGSKTERAHSLFRVDGNNMEPLYHEGDLLFFRFARTAYPRQDVVCSSADGMFVKRLAADSTLYSVNPDRLFRNYGDKNVRIVGIVTGVADESDFPPKTEEPFLAQVFEEELKVFERKPGADSRLPVFYANHTLVQNRIKRKYTTPNTSATSRAAFSAPPII